MEGFLWTILVIKGTLECQNPSKCLTVEFVPGTLATSPSQAQVLLTFAKMLSSQSESLEKDLE